MNKIFFLLLALSALYLGFQAGGEKTESQEVQNSLDAHPNRSFPITQNFSFTFVIYGSNQEAWIKRCLSSIFSQDYDAYRVIFIDDASLDHTYAAAKDFVMDAAQDERVILIRNEEKLGPAASLYRAAEHSLDREILIPIEAKDWLSQEDILRRLNLAFQNPDVWIAESKALGYPEYQVEETDGIFAFYGALLKNVPAQEFFIGGRLCMSKEAYKLPLRELAGGRVKQFLEPFVFMNRAAFSPSEKQVGFLSSRSRLKPLAAFPEKKDCLEKADLLVFSYDRPLQLYAFLESLQHYVTGLSSIFVIYRGSDDRYQNAYLDLQKTFGQIQWIRQSDTPHKDFKPLVLQALKNGSAPYILFAVDDIIVKDFVDVSQCAQLMEKTGAYGFYLRLGSHVQYCYMMDQPQKIPPHLPLASNILAWDFRAAEHDWAFANTLDMTVYRKEDIMPFFEKLSYKHPNRLEQSWASHRSENSIGLCFETSKVVNLPLNLVNPSDCRHSHFMTAEELLVKWNEGVKLDIHPLFQIENASPHMDYIPDFVAR